jgi:hypothetical protein
MIDLAEQIEPEVSSPSPELAYMSNEQLLAHTLAMFQTIASAIPYIVELRSRFARLKRGSANICGCRTWQQFCFVHLHRSDRRIRQVISAHALLLAKNQNFRGQAVREKRARKAKVFTCPNCGHKFAP